MKRRRKLLGIIAVLLILLLVILPPAVLTIFVHRHVDYLGEETKSHALQGIYKASDYGIEETIHTFTTSDKETVWCSEITAEKPKGVIIYLTGIMQPSITYFYGHAAWMQENGFASFLLEVRSHGNSSGNLIGLGYTEVTDVQSVVTYIKSCEEYKDLPIIIQGVSMGGAIAINSFGQIPEIAGCIAMSPYASFETQVDLLLSQYHIPKFLRAVEAPLVKQTLRLIYGSNTVETLSPSVQITNAKERPILLVACSGDASVSYENSKMLHDTYPDAKLWIRDSWEHFIVKDCNFKEVTKDSEYCSKILSWITEQVLE